MLDDGTISATRVIAGFLWTLVISLLVAAWATALWGPHHVGGMLAATACAASGVAATAQIRVYSLSVCNQLRVMRADQDSMRESIRPGGTVRGL